MHRKRDDVSGDGKQLFLPFENESASSDVTLPQSNVFYFSDKIDRNKCAKENKDRKRSISRLLCAAEKLNW